MTKEHSAECICAQCEDAKARVRSDPGCVITSNQCAICGEPATCAVLKDPFGKSDATEGRCAKHSPRLRGPQDVAEIERLQRSLETVEAWRLEIAAERDRLRAALRRIAFDAFGPPEASAHVVLDMITECARAALAGESSPSETPAEPVELRLCECGDKRKPCGSFHGCFCQRCHLYISKSAYGYGKPVPYERYEPIAVETGGEP